jgi:hypothetical protein
MTLLKGDLEIFRQLSSIAVARQKMSPQIVKARFVTFVRTRKHTHSDDFILALLAGSERGANRKLYHPRCENTSLSAVSQV